MISEPAPRQETQIDLVGAEQPPFVLFPLEIWMEILHRLEVDDILRIRRVCSYLHCASRQRSLWISILQNPPPPMDLYSFLVDKKLELCTSSDLEAIVVNCLRKHKVWGDPSLLRRRELVGVPGRGPVLIVPGGRWAITFDDTENVVAFDLHHLDRPFFVLCSRSPGGVPWDIEATLQTQEAGVQDELKLAIYSRDRASRAHIEVWLIQPSYDGNGQVDGLKSKRLSSFTCCLLERPRSFAISGSFVSFVYRIRVGQSVAGGAVAIDWAEADGQDDFAKCQKHALRTDNLYHCRIFCLLPNGTLLTNSGDGYELWDMASLQPVFHLQDAAEGQPIFKDGAPFADYDCGSLYVISSDGKPRAAHTRPESIEGVIVSTIGIEYAASTPIRLNQGADKLIRIRIHAIDKVIELREPWEGPDSFATLKSAWFGSTRPCSMTSFSFELPECSRFYIDPYSGLIAIGHRITHNQTLVDFPFVDT